MEARFLVQVLAGVACTIGGVHFWTGARAAERGLLGEPATSSGAIDAGQSRSLAPDAASATPSDRPREPDGDLKRAIPRDQSSDPDVASAPAEFGSSTAPPTAPDSRSDTIPLVRLESLSLAATTPPRVPEVFARAALRRVGLDASAEATWRAAIDDLQLPPEARSDLIEDLNDEGFPTRRRLGEADLPLILARLEIVERLAPRQRDDVNVAAFQEAYKDLLEMLVSVKGGRRRR